MRSAPSRSSRRAGLAVAAVVVTMLAAGCGQGDAQGPTHALGVPQTALTAAAVAETAAGDGFAIRDASLPGTAHVGAAVSSLATAISEGSSASSDAAWVSPPTTTSFGGVTSGSAGGRSDARPISQDPLVFVAHPSAEARELLVSALTASSGRAVSGTMRYGVVGTFEMVAAFEVDSDGDAALRIAVAAPGQQVGRGEDVEFELIVVAATGLVYARPAGDLPGADNRWPEGWILLGDDAAGEAGFLCPVDPLTGGQAVCAAPNDLAALIDLVDVAGTAGSARIGPHDTTHVRFTAAAAVWDDMLRPEVLAAAPPPSLPMNAWIDRDGLLRRIGTDADAFTATLSVLFDSFAADIDAGAIADLLRMLRIEMSFDFDSYQPVPDITAPAHVAADFSSRGPSS